jgi:hypothetical protein
LVIKGSAPKGLLFSGITFHNNAVLRFEIPVSGYSTDYSAIEVPTFSPHTSTTLEVDYAGYLAAGGGTVTLVSFTKDPSEELEPWLARQAAAMNLPKGTKLRLVHDERGYRITFKAMKNPGMVISFK